MKFVIWIACLMSLILSGCCHDFNYHEGAKEVEKTECNKISSDARSLNTGGMGGADKPSLAKLVGVDGPSLTEEEIMLVNEFQHGLYALEYDSDGNLTNPLEVTRAIDDLKNGAYKKILIVSTGWGHRKDVAIQDYLHLIYSYLQAVENDFKDDEYCNLRPHITDKQKDILKDWAIILVAWDSQATGINGTVRDVFPINSLSNFVTAIPEYGLFPLTYWSKAKLADMIGLNGLRQTIRHIVTSVYGEDPKGQPGIYVIGHSFGARVVNALMQQQREVFSFLRIDNSKLNFKAALYILPAISNINIMMLENNKHESQASLPIESDIPVVVVQSRYDHGNSFLYPIANMISKSFCYTSYEMGLSGLKADNTKADVIRYFVNLLEIPLCAINTALLEVFDYPYGIFKQVTTRHINIIPDTLAQIPIVQQLVRGLSYLLDENFGTNLEWGQYHKGFLELGVLTTESAARIGVPNHPEPVSLDCLIGEKNGEGCRFDMKNNIRIVDASKYLSRSWAGYDMSNPFFDATLGWVDPIGSHTTFDNSYIFKLIHNFLNDKIQYGETSRGIPGTVYSIDIHSSAAILPPCHESHES
jgi:hypothetical protein